MPSWWYWQAFRTWVPYAEAVNKAIENSYSTTRTEVDIGGGRKFRFRRDGTGLQYSTEFPGRHREAVRLPALASATEFTLRHCTFERLVTLDATSGHNTRLAAAETASKKLDRQYSLMSMERTIREQLQFVDVPPGGWILGLSLIHI